MSSTVRPGGNPGVNPKSISHRCYLFEVAFVWALTEDPIILPLCCLQGEFGRYGRRHTAMGDFKDDRRAGGDRGVVSRRRVSRKVHLSKRPWGFKNSIIPASVGECPSIPTCMWISQLEPRDSVNYTRTCFSKSSPFRDVTCQHCQQ